MLGQLPIKPESLAADTGYSAGPLRKHLEEVGITAYIPIHPNQKNSVVAQRGFTYHGDHLVCPEGKVLRRRAFHSRDRSYQYVAHQKDCQKCPVEFCKQKRRFVALTMYQPVYLRAKERNESEAYKQEMASRRSTVEGVFASQDRLGWERCKLRGLWKVTVRATYRRLRTTFRRPCASLEEWARLGRRSLVNGRQWPLGREKEPDMSAADMNNEWRGAD